MLVAERIGLLEAVVPGHEISGWASPGVSASVELLWCVGVVEEESCAEANVAPPTANAANATTVRTSFLNLFITSLSWVVPRSVRGPDGKEMKNAISLLKV